MNFTVMGAQFTLHTYMPLPTLDSGEKGTVHVYVVCYGPYKMYLPNIASYLGGLHHCPLHELFALPVPCCLFVSYSCGTLVRGSHMH